MAITLIHDDDSFDGEDSSGNVSITRTMLFSYESGDTQMTLESSALRPHSGDAHPRNAAFTVESISGCEYSDIPKEYKLEVKYKKSNGSGISVTTGGNSEIAPWQLGVQNFRKSYASIQRPLTRIFKPGEVSTPSKGYFDLVNGAGDPIVYMQEIQYMVVSFDRNFQYKGSLQKTNDSVLYNASSVHVCGIQVEPYHGKLMPITSELHKVYKNDGKTIKWQYETCHFEVHIIDDPFISWAIEFLNVGNRAKFTVNGQKQIQQIFQYTPWTSTDQTVNAGIQPRFGSIDDVIRAIKAYRGVTGNNTDTIPWAEAENIPLTYDGEIDTAAITSRKYKRISGYERSGVSWTVYGVPTTL